MTVAPAAQTHDGRFDVAVVAGVPRARARAALRGGGRTLFAARLTAVPVLETHGRVAVECDGEWAGHLPATFEVLRRVTVALSGVPGRTSGEFTVIPLKVKLE